MKGLRAERMLRRDGSLEIDETEIGVKEDVRDIGKERVPATVIGDGGLLNVGVVWSRSGRRCSGACRRLLLCGIRRLHDRFMRNHVARGGESDSTDLLKIRRCRSGLLRSLKGSPNENGGQGENTEGNHDGSNRPGSLRGA